MSEVVQEVQEQPETPEVSPEDRLAIAAGIESDPNEKPRDDKGRFVKQEGEQAQEQQEQTTETKEATAEQPKETEEAAEEVLDWEQIKALKVKVPMKNGEKEWQEEKTFEDLRNERMMHADYMERRREMEKKEKDLQTQYKETVEKERTQYIDSLKVLHQSVLKAADVELGNVDWQKLAIEDPSSYVKLQARANMFGQTLQQIEAEHRASQEKQQKELEESQLGLLRESEVKLKEAIPTWGEETKKAVFDRGVKTYNFKPDELGRVIDHRIVQVLHDAHQWRLMQEGKTTSEKKVTTLPPVLRPKAHTPKVNPQVQEFQKARERIKENPLDLDAAADLMGAFIQPRRG